MTSVVFELDMFDSVEEPLQIDLEEFHDHVTTHDVDFREEFLSRLWNYIAYSVSGAQNKNFEEIVYTMHLDVEGLDDYVQIDFLSEGDDRWHKLATELEAISDYGSWVAWDFMDNRLAAYLAYVSYDGWKWEEKTFKKIRERMVGFKGIYNDKTEVVDELIESQELDPIPSYVVHDEAATADEAEDMGYFSSYPFGRYSIAVWI